MAQRFAPDTIIHNAGVIRPALLADVKLDDLDALVDIHLSCAIQLVQAALPAMKARSASAASCCCRRAPRWAWPRAPPIPPPRPACWAWRAPGRWSWRPHGITVNVVAPGPVRTDMFHDVMPVGDPKVAQIAAGIPVKRLGEPADVAHAVRFFVSEHAGFVTGQVLYVCGGTSVGSLTL